MKWIRAFVLPAMLVLLLACDGMNEKKSSQNVDSLFLAISLGMEKKAFYDHCWELNRQRVFTHGPTNQEVEYVLKDSLLRTNVIMRFYPKFHDDKIYQMPVRFIYEPWAPWNRQYWADSLIKDMSKLFKKWYGDDFKTTTHPVHGTIYYKIDGHRRINLFMRDEQFVQAVFSDMRVADKLKREAEEFSLDTRADN